MLECPATLAEAARFIPLQASDPGAMVAMKTFIITYVMTERYPSGPKAPRGNAAYPTIEMIADGVALIDSMRATLKPGVRVTLKVERRKGKDLLVPAIAVTYSRQTELLPLKITEGLMELDGEAHALQHPEGAAVLVNALMAAIDSVFPDDSGAGHSACPLCGRLDD